MKKKNWYIITLVVVFVLTISIYAIYVGIKTYGKKSIEDGYVDYIENKQEYELIDEEYHGELIDPSLN